MSSSDPAHNYQWPDHQKNYALSGKIMLSSIIILFVVVIFLVLLHLYARWYLRRLYHHNDTRRRNRRTHIVFHVDNNTIISSPPTEGLDAAVLKSLPVFVYSSQKSNQNLVECAVCLSEFEDGETGRVLPKCKHGFHTECIDMWFHSHSTCPLCRTPVEPVEPADELEMKVAINEPGSSGWFNETRSFGDRRKGIDVRIDIPSRNELNDSSFRMMSPTLGFRSPGSHLQSLKRILTMSRKSPAVSPSAGVGPSGVIPSVEHDRQSDIESVSQQQTANESTR